MNPNSFFLCVCVYEEMQLFCKEDEKNLWCQVGLITGQHFKHMAKFHQNICLHNHGDQVTVNHKKMYLLNEQII